MGTWGPALFSDDTACDVRDRYVELLGEGHNGPEAMNLLLADFPLEAKEAVFWLALAATQYRFGRLEERVKKKVIKIIDSGRELGRWKGDSKLLSQRRKHLHKLREQLAGAQRPAKHIPKRFKDSTAWGVGDILAYPLASGQLAILRVIGHHTDHGGTSPVVELLKWTKDEIPSAAALGRRAFKRGVRPHQDITQFCVGSLSEREIALARVQRLDFRLPPAQECGGYSAVAWRNLDKYLALVFGME